VVALAQSLADPKRPLGLDRAASRMWSTRTMLGVLGIIAALAGLALAWYCTPLSGFAALIGKWSPDVVAVQEIDSRRRSEDPFARLAAFVGGHHVDARAIVTEDGDYGQVLLSRFTFAPGIGTAVSLPA
jgi:hypothetical protein